MPYTPKDKSVIKSKTTPLQGNITEEIFDNALYPVLKKTGDYSEILNNNSGNVAEGFSNMVLGYSNTADTTSFNNAILDGYSNVITSGASNITIVNGHNNYIYGDSGYTGSSVFININNFSGTPVDNTTYIGDKLKLNIGTGIVSGGTNTLTVDSLGNVFFQPGFGSGSTGSTTVLTDFKAGGVPASAFTGNPRKATVVFDVPYSDTNYVPVISGSDARAYFIENKTITGFDINTNSSFPLTDFVYFNNTTSGETSSVSTNLLYGSFGINANTIGTTLATGTIGYAIIPYDCTITDWYLIGNAVGSVVIDVKRTAVSLVGGGNFPTLTAQQRNNATESGWSTTLLSRGDEIQFVVTSSSGINKIWLTILVTKT